MNLKKLSRALVSLILAVTICTGTCANTFAATGSSKYIKEVIISYGETEKEAHKWLTDNGYEVLNYNLNEGANDSFSTERAVYIGYKTTDDADEAITDMKLMNMKGGYSVQDYQMLLDEQKLNIKNFFDDFKIAVKEYRNNYNAGQQRAIAAHDMLNMLYEDDTQQYMGDLLLNKVREEYTDEEYNALPDEEKAKVGDMTTILMQGNADAVLTIEQTIATATDEGDTLWFERYDNAKTYDEMVDELMESEDLTVDQAEKKLAAEYDDDAYSIATKLEDYKTYLEQYTNSDISFESTEDEISAYQNEHEDFDIENWLAAGTQYEMLKTLVKDDVSLYDLITSVDYDLVVENRSMLYPLVSVLTDGQRACLDFLTMYQIVCLGTNNDEATEQATDEIDIDQVQDLQTSVYSGIDRSVFGADVALTGDAYRLQHSYGTSPMYNWTDSISTASIALYASVAVSLAGTIGAWVYNSRVSSILGSRLEDIQLGVNSLNRELTDLTRKLSTTRTEYVEVRAKMQQEIDRLKADIQLNSTACGNAKLFQRVITIASVAITCITVALLVASIWSTWQDLQTYYNATFTPIPSNMVNQSIDENDKKVYTYYKAVKCNRVEQGMVTDASKILGDIGDLNGDVGKQWVALYTTTDSAAGDPITTDFAVQYNDTNIPGDRTPLSMFDESSAQNLTNKNAGYTYADSNKGIYVFYDTDSNAFAASIFTNGKYILVGGISAMIAAAIAFFVGKSVGRKKGNRKISWR